MARYAVSCSVSSTLNGNPRVLSAGSVADMVGSVPYTTVDANVATLVADAASPTQAHVTTLNTNWGTLKGILNPTTQDVVLSFDNANVTTKTQLRAAVLALLAALDGSSVLTP